MSRHINVEVLRADELNGKSLDDVRKPFVLRGFDIGLCIKSWKEKSVVKSLVPADKLVTYHVSQHCKLDFLSKNFSYRTTTFHNFLDLCASDQFSAVSQTNRSFYYLRSLGDNQRDDVADVFRNFPDLAAQVKLPKFLWSNFDEKYFSSVLRISSPDLQLWTHYDIMDNILLQIVGSKEVVLFDPQDLKYLYLNGDKSLVLDIENPDVNKFPKFVKATKYCCTLNEGDILFIPALWFHNTKALSYSIGLNVFWKHLEDSLYDKKDVYGNKDLIPAQKAFQSCDKSFKLLESLPDIYQKFYALRLIEKLKNKYDL